MNLFIEILNDNLCTKIDKIGKLKKMKNNNYKKYEKLSQDPNNQFDAVGYLNFYYFFPYWQN